MKNNEILIVQDYLKITFGNEEIQIRKPETENDLNSIFINNSRVGNIFRDIDPDDKEVTYTLSIPISLSSDNNVSHQQYLIDLLGTDKIFLTGRGSIDDSQEVYLRRNEDDEYIGIIYKNDDSSYTFTMSILDFDL
tara:strand:- start:8547 stop:8954 length:408 start_codon:yes stop_codon:yes gene_type:complete